MCRFRNHWTMSKATITIDCTHLMGFINQCIGTYSVKARCPVLLVSFSWGEKKNGVHVNNFSKFFRSGGHLLSNHNIEQQRVSTIQNYNHIQWTFFVAPSIIPNRGRKIRQSYFGNQHSCQHNFPVDSPLDRK